MTPAEGTEPSIESVLNDLKSRGLVDPKRRLVHLKEKNVKRPVIYVRVNLISRPIIAYRFGRFHFSTNSLRFILLHEEKHVRLLWITILPIVLLFTADMTVAGWFSGVAPPFNSSVFLLLLLLISIYPSVFVFRCGEIRADLWSAQNMRDAFGIQLPSEVARQALTWANGVGWPRRVLRLVFGRIHPTAEERVRRIAQKVDANPPLESQSKSMIP